jgi:hypothetical protein
MVERSAAWWGAPTAAQLVYPMAVKLVDSLVDSLETLLYELRLAGRRLPAVTVQSRKTGPETALSSPTSDLLRKLFLFQIMRSLYFNSSPYYLDRQ